MQWVRIRGKDEVWGGLGGGGVNKMGQPIFIVHE